MKIDEKNYLEHYGILRRSGRYPWGSSNNVPQRSKDFLDYIQEMKNKGMTEAQIARGLSTEEHPFTTTDLRALRTIARAEKKASDISMAQRLKDKGYSNGAIAERMGLPGESSVRALLKPGEKDKADNLRTVSNMLRGQVDEKGYIDVGIGVETQIGISKDKLATAVSMLREEGYELHNLKIDTAIGNQTNMKVLGPPGTTQKDAWMNRDKIRQIDEWSEDGGRTLLGLHEPISISSKRIAVRYDEDGGSEADGVIYIRPGVEDLSLGGNSYAQVRVAVDGTHYLKGMAVYKDDLADGVDVVFNTNKPRSVGKLGAMKEMQTDAEGNIDWDNPFGSYISRQVVSVDSKGKERVTSAMNMVNEEGDWDEWSKSLSSQVLSKQSPTLARTQLNMSYEQRKNDFDEIMSLTNPVVRRKLLEDFADNADSAAVQLKAKQLPGQRTQVILPVSSLKETEIYAPNFKNGDSVVLIRYPHGGPFEIPELKVNNRHAEAKRLLGSSPIDAVGINSKVAERLSGADFDGDTVLVIPNNNRKVKTRPALEGLKDFDPQRAYPAVPGTTFKGNKQQMMGDVSNLITDMSIKGASADELARAVRHSMVVIDAEKHNLNYKLSAENNGIRALKEKYQGASNAGASTLISRAKSQANVPERKQGYRVNPETGEKIFTETGRSYTDQKGNVIRRTTRSTKLAETNDAHTLSSGQPIEKVYADHSNKLKALANEARKQAINTKSGVWSDSAKKTYAKEVSSLNAKLNIALKNAPRERQAQILAGATVSAKRRANPGMDKAEVKKLKYQALAESRRRVGAGKEKIEINWDEWNAIQAGAISPSKLKRILDHADMDEVKKKATPRENLVMTSVKQTRAKAMLASGYSQSEVAEALGVALSTLKSSIGKD